MSKAPDRYAATEFPVYKFVEYPKWVTLLDGSRRLVESAREELRVLSEQGASPPDPEQDEKLRLARENAELRAKLAEMERAKTEVLTPEELELDLGVKTPSVPKAAVSAGLIPSRPAIAPLVKK